MLRRHATVFVAMATSLPDILLVVINGWKLIREFGTRGSEVREEAMSPIKN